MIEESPGDLLQWLRGFYFVAQKGSVTQATLVMGREQPTITRQIKCLEKELGVTLFDRSSGKMKLTPEGRALFEKSISLFEDVKEIRNGFKREDASFDGRIVIAASHTVIDSFLPRYIVEFRTAHPGVHFHLDGNVFEGVVEKVESAEADFGIALVDSLPATLVCYDLFEAGQKLIAPKGNKFFLNAPPTLKQIAQSPMILFSRTGSLEAFIAKRFAQEGLNPQVILTHNSFVSAKKYVSLGLGVAILSDYAISDEDEQLFDIYSLDRYLEKRRYGILLRRRKYLSPAVKAFIRTIKPEIQFAK